MKNNVLEIILLSILAFGIYISTQVSYLHFTKEVTYEKFLDIPICFIGSFYFIFLFLLQVLKKNISFFIFLGAGLALSTYASLGYLLHRFDCVSSYIDIPVCYITLVVFLLTMLFKFKQLKKSAS